MLVWFSLSLTAEITLIKKCKLCFEFKANLPKLLYSWNIFIFKTKAKSNTEQQLENIKRLRNALPQKDESLEGKIKDMVAEIGKVIKQSEIEQMSGQGSKG